MSITLGSGVFSWNRYERVTDRYGSVLLLPEGGDSRSLLPQPSQINRELAKQCDGLKGKLSVKVTATRESTHIGDFCRGLVPKTPKVGATIKLGEGVFFIEPAIEGGVQIGVRPADGRASDWLNPKALYRAHEQSVHLIFGQAA